MAVNYQAMTTITNGTTAASVTALGTAIKTLIVANAAWSLQEDITPTTTTTTTRFMAFKCDHTVSGLTNDFYVLFYFTSVSSMVTVVGEAYNTGTHTISGVGPTNSSVTVDSAGRMPVPATLSINASTGALATTGTTGPMLTAVSSAAATTVFWMGLVYPDHLVIGAGTSQAGVTNCYLGGYTSLIPTPATNDAFNFCSVGLTINTNAAGSCSREPLTIGAVTKTFFGIITGPTSTPSSGNLYEYARAVASGAFDYYQGVYAVTRVYLLNQGTVAGVANTGVRGLYSNMFIATALPPSIAFGDTVTYNGTSWAYVATGVFSDTGA